REGQHAVGLDHAASGFRLVFQKRAAVRALIRMHLILNQHDRAADGASDLRRPSRELCIVLLVMTPELLPIAFLDLLGSRLDLFEIAAVRALQGVAGRVKVEPRAALGTRKFASRRRSLGALSGRFGRSRWRGSGGHGGTNAWGAGEGLKRLAAVR